MPEWHETVLGVDEGGVDSAVEPTFGGLALGWARRVAVPDVVGAQ